MILRVLTVLFLLQVALVATLYWPQQSAPVNRESLLTTIAPDSVNGITLSNGDGATLVLVRDTDGWRLDIGLPADSNKVDALLQVLLAKDPGFPIADSDIAAKRFEVSETEFQRKIILNSSGGQATAYLGSAPALRKVHARREGENAVFVLPFSSFDAPVDIDSWLDTRLLSQPALSTFTLYGTQYVLREGRWSRSDDQNSDEDKVTAVAQVLANLQISGLVDPADDDAASAGEALRITMGNDEQRSQLAVLHNPESDRYYLQSERFGKIFSTSAYDAERLIEAASALLKNGMSNGTKQSP
ncbi:DUF4340 domain-containing protein [Congregibacter variabilis]|uniref:DUF4340 domain-containing protein n=1 Tax=Congregibacter variabilis TaxID=3081200 RepID=A0ABZ0HYH0_9GAMM|nr:DUF4340 domain-containing protein [Congregibacter sp. IMCC43200]